MKREQKIILGITLTIIAVLLLLSLFSKKDSYSAAETTNVIGPVDSLLKVYSSKNNVSIILSDMDYLEDSDLYRHKYNIIYSEPVYNTMDAIKVELDSLTGDTILIDNNKEKTIRAVLDSTDWIAVDVVYFDKYINDLGMEIATIDSLGQSKSVAPGGFSNYVGNENYGYWDNSTANWMFYPRFSFLDIWLMHQFFPVRYSHWGTYNTGGFRNSGRSYYGSDMNGNRLYGTDGKASTNHKNRTWSKKTSFGKSRVKSNSSAAARKKTSFGGKRSSSRYGTSSRSRGGGFGK